MKKNGSILVISAWFLTVFNLALFSLAFQAASQVKMIKRERDTFADHYLFLSGTNLVMSVIESDVDPYNDSPLDPWHGSIKLDKKWSDKVSIQLEDENAKLNLNKASDTMLQNLFVALKKEDAGKEILKWRAKNRSFHSLEELFTVDTVTREDFEGLKNYLTVYGNQPLPKVNINTVSLLLLEVILKSISADDFAKNEFLGKIREAREKEKAEYFEMAELTPEALLSKLKLFPNIQMISLLNQLMPYLTTDSRVFRLHLKTVETQRNAEAVIEHHQDGFPVFEILSWHEE